MWVSTLGYNVFKSEGNKVATAEVHTCNLKLAHGSVGREEGAEGDGSMGISVLMSSLIIYSINWFQPTSSSGVTLATIRRVELH